MAARPQNVSGDRAEAERAFNYGLTSLAGVALGMADRLGADTQANARKLAEAMEAGIGQLVTARRLLLQRAGVL
ncbi:MULTISPECIES: hypothetical protein [unclassified Methylobacterium]|uniref:hypothetical protein n=1 Tax=unclassified Methylobacterium TaxID=2615210 RepID=UPI002269E134|nr:MULTISPECIES: hypothetical protein [unclassified Methylobacterium]